MKSGLVSLDHDVTVVRRDYRIPGQTVTPVSSKQTRQALSGHAQPRALARIDAEHGLAA